MSDKTKDKVKKSIFGLKVKPISLKDLISALTRISKELQSGEISPGEASIIPGIADHIFVYISPAIGNSALKTLIIQDLIVEVRGGPGVNDLDDTRSAKIVLEEHFDLVRIERTIFKWKDEKRVKSLDDRENLCFDLENCVSCLISENDFSDINVTMMVKVRPNAFRFVLGDAEMISIKYNKFNNLSIDYTSDNIDSDGKNDNYRRCTTKIEGNVAESITTSVSKSEHDKLSFLFTKNKSITSLNISHDANKVSFSSDKYKVRVVEGNRIESINIRGNYPDIVRWGLTEKIGERIIPLYKKERKVHQKKYRESLKNANKQYRKDLKQRMKMIIEEYKSQDPQLKFMKGSYDIEIAQANLIYRRDVISARENALEELKNNYNEVKSKYEGMLEDNKSVLKKIRGIAIERGGMLQEKAIGYHIIKSDEFLLRLEKGLWQDKTTMFFGGLLSRHGTLWFLPLFWIAGSNLFFAAGIYALIHYGSTAIIDYRDIALALFNPLSEPIDITNKLNEIGVSIPDIVFYLFGTVFLLAKGFYAICIYEFIRAARRFTV